MCWDLFVWDTIGDARTQPPLTTRSSTSTPSRFIPLCSATISSYIPSALPAETYTRTPCLTRNAHPPAGVNAGEKYGLARDGKWRV